MADAKIGYGVTSAGVPTPFKVTTNGNLVVSLDGSVYPEVANFAALPDATLHVSELYVVLASQGLFWPTKKKAGIYISDGGDATDWRRLGKQAENFNDANFNVFNDSDITKRVKLDLSGVTTSTDRTLIVPDSSGTLSLKEAQTVTVAISGGDFTTIAGALASITDASAIKPYEIKIGAGVFSTAPFTMKSYVNVQGLEGSTIISASTTTSALITMASNTEIKDISITGADGVGGIAVTNTVGNTGIICKNITVMDCETGFLFTGASTQVTLNNCICLRVPTQTMTTAYNFNTNALVNCLGIQAIGNVAAKITTGFDIDTSCESNIQSITVIDATTGLSIDGSANLEIESGFIQDCTTGILLDDAILSMLGIDCKDNTTDINVTNTGAEMRIAGSNIDSTKMTFIAGFTNKIGAFVDPSSDAPSDKGLTVFGELNVGTPEKGHEAAFGEGDSTARGMLVYTENTSNTFVDVSSEAQSETGSTFTFTGIAADNRIYVGSSLDNGTAKLFHYGIKAITTTATVLGAGEIRAEYYNGSAWVEFNTMSTKSSPDYTRHAKSIFERVATEQIRYCPDMLTDWTANDPMTLGTSYFWIRLVIQTAITTAPIFEQFKLHTNRFEANEDGFNEYFGNSRPTGQLNWKMTDNQAFGLSPTNQDIFLYNNVAGELDIGMGGLENGFVNSATDVIGNVFRIPPDMDTSTPITVKLLFTADATGDVFWFANIGLRALNETVAFTAGAAESTSSNIKGYDAQSAATAVGTAYEIKEASFDLDVSLADDGDLIFISLARDGTNVLDTNGGLVALIQLDAVYAKWSNGGFR